MFCVFQGSSAAAAPVSGPPAKKMRVLEEYVDANDCATETQNKMAAGVSAGKLKEIKEKVRSLATQNEPNESLMLLLLDDLARMSLEMGDESAPVFSELYRQARYNQGNVDLPNFILTVLGGGACDVVSKALAKYVKKQHKSPKLEKRAGESPEKSVSPLTNLYPGSQAMQFMPFFPGFPNQYYQPRGRGYRGSYSRGGYRGGKPSLAAQCWFCQGNHYIRDCDKMKAARDK